MSLIAYEVLTAHPDFTETPTFGIDDERETINSPGGSTFAAWNGKTDRTFLFDFQLSSTEEWRTFREFFDRMGGRAGAFYLPSWQHDFELAEDAAAGATQICVAGHWHTENMTENRPDTLGRVIFTMNHLGVFSAHLVTSTSAGGGNDYLTLYEPIAAGMEAGRTVVGFCYLARLVNDTIETFHPSPADARTTLGFREITQTRRLNQAEVAPGEVVGTLHASADLVATDEDPILFNTRYSEAAGPFNFGGAQTENYTSTWQANVMGNTIELTSPADLSFTTALYDGTSSPRHISFAFDASSRDVIAWENGLNSSRIAWRNGTGDTARMSFSGISPVLYNTFAIDSTVSAGEATVAVFYLKPHDSTIYCRIIAEEFAIEHRYCKSPVAPLRLFRARRFEARLELVGMDTGHRRARWRSETYQTPQAPELQTSKFEGILGLYSEVTVKTTGTSLGQSSRFESLTGTYESLRIQATGTSPGQSSRFESLTGTYESLRIQATGTPDTATSILDGGLMGEYKLVRKQTTATSPGQSSRFESLTGTYAPV